MHLSNERLIVILIVGVTVGYLVGRVVRGSGFGVVGDAAVGIVGALLGIWLLPRFGVHFVGDIAALVVDSANRSNSSVADSAVGRRERVGREPIDERFVGKVRPEGIGVSVYDSRLAEDWLRICVAKASQNANQVLDRERRAFRNSDSDALCASSSF